MVPSGGQTHGWAQVHRPYMVMVYARITVYSAGLRAGRTRLQVRHSTAFSPLPRPAAGDAPLPEAPGGGRGRGAPDPSPQTVPVGPP